MDERAHGVKVQVCTILLVTTFVVLFEMAIYLVGVVPTARQALDSILRRSGTKRTGLNVALDGWLALAEERERPLVQANNQACVFRGLVIAATLMVMLVGIFYHFPDFREVRLGGMWRDVVLSVVLIAVFQVNFFFMGRQWLYPSGEQYIEDVVKQYREDAVADGSEPKAEPRLRRLWT